MGKDDGEVAGQFPSTAEGKGVSCVVPAGPWAGRGSGRNEES